MPFGKDYAQGTSKRGINGVKVLYSKEEPKGNGGRTPASISFVPSVAGLLIAKTVIDDLYVL